MGPLLACEQLAWGGRAGGWAPYALSLPPSPGAFYMEYTGGGLSVGEEPWEREKKQMEAHDRSLPPARPFGSPTSTRSCCLSALCVTNRALARSPRPCVVRNSPPTQHAVPRNRWMGVEGS